MPIEQRVECFETLLAHLDLEGRTESNVAIALRLEIVFMRWVIDNKASIELAHQLTKADLVDVVPDLSAHPEATRRFVERLRAEEQAPESALIREQFPGAEIIDVVDAADSDVTTSQMELLDD